MITFSNLETKQHSRIKYWGCILVKSISGEWTVLNLICRISSWLKFLDRKKNILTSSYLLVLATCLFSLILIVLVQLGILSNSKKNKKEKSILSILHSLLLDKITRKSEKRVWKFKQVTFKWEIQPRHKLIFFNVHEKPMPVLYIRSKYIKSKYPSSNLQFSFYSIVGMK